MGNSTIMHVKVLARGYICDLHQARKEFTCCVSGLTISPGEYYFSCTLAGAGLASLKFPDRVKFDYITTYIISKEGGNGSTSTKIHPMKGAESANR